jgi:hypothetical protein
VQRLMVRKSQHSSVSKDENKRLIKPLEAMSQLQFMLSTYSDVPTEIVPELVPVDGWHRRPQEHVTLPTPVAADPVDTLYFPATHAVHVSPSGTE